MKKVNLKAFLPDEVTKTIVTKLSKESIKQLKTLSKFYKSSNEKIITGLINKELNKASDNRLLGQKIVRYREENKDKQKLIFTVLPKVKENYDRLTDNEESYSKSSYVESWIREAYTEMISEEGHNEI